MSGGEELLRRLVGLLQRVFYAETLPAGADKAPFYRDLRMLREAVTFPAGHIRDYGSGEFRAERYEEIFREVVKKVALHGTPAAQMRRRGAYILHAVQDHWRHNWEAYAHESRAAGEAAEAEMRAIAARGEAAAGDRAMQVLAAAHDALREGRPKGKKTAARKKGAGELQGELF